MQHHVCSDRLVQLPADEAVMMRKLYDSVSAPDSVAVMSLSGSLLGYVPRRHIHRFVHDTNFGHVYAINQDAAGLWRLTVSSNFTSSNGLSLFGLLHVTASCKSAAGYATWTAVMLMW